MMILLLLPLLANAAVLQVCNSGCTYSYVQDALDAASRGDTIMLRAGQTHYGKASFPRPVQLLYKSAEAKYITLISDRWTELPPAGTRIDPVLHAPLLATIANELNSDPVVFQAEDYVPASSVNTGADTVTFSYDPGWANGDPVGCAATYAGGVMPGGMAENTTYYVTGKSGATMGFATTAGGSAINLSAGFTGMNCQREYQSHHYRFIGIRFARGGTLAGGMVSLASGHEPTAAAYGHHFEFRHVVFCGMLSSNTNCTYTGVGDYHNGPLFGLYMNSNYVEVVDSWFGHFKLESGESKSISVNWSSHVKIRNNRLSAASIVLLIAGSVQAIQNYSGTDYDISGNLLEGEAYYYWKAGSGAPSGDCENGTLDTNGAYYIDTTGTGGSSCSGTKCWVCNTSRTWVQRTDVDYRPGSPLMKAMFEAKEGQDIRFIGNYIRGGFVGPDPGNPNTCMLLSQAAIQSPWTAISGTFKYNYCFETWRFFTADNAWPYTFTRQIGPVLAEHNIAKDLAKHPSRNPQPISGDGSSFSQASQWGDGIENVIFRHNTATQHSNVLTYTILFGHEDSGYTMPGWKYTANIAPYASYGGAGNCSQLGAYLTDATNQLTRSVWFGTGASHPYGACSTDVAAESTMALEADLSITPASKYAKDCVSSCGFLAEDGTEIGADVPRVNYEVSGSINGTGKWLRTLKIDTGSGFATLSYDAPSTAACSVKLYTNAARTTLHGDTSDAGEQADDRTGNYSIGVQRIFKLGTNTALTASTTYYGLITCGTQVRPFKLRTKAAGSGRTVPVSYSTARTGEYSASSDFSSPTAISSSALHKVPVSANSVVWYRETGGIARAFVAP